MPDPAQDRNAQDDVAPDHPAHDGARTVRSFVFRRARLNKLHRRAIERLSDRYVLDLPEAASAGLSLFDRFGVECSRKVLEIGFGMGYATAEYASQSPGTCVLGSEVYPPGVGKLLSEIERRELKAVRIVRRDAVEVLESGIRMNEVDAVHVFFPDPWPKKKHHKRRLVQPSFLDLVADRLKPGGILYVTTDWEDYAQHIASVFAEHDRFVNQEPAADDRRKSVPRPWRPRTAFERKGLAKGHTVSEFFYRLVQ